MSGTRRAGGLACIIVLALTGGAWTQGVDITLVNTPIHPPILIPEAGGSYAYHLEVRNGEPTPEVFDLWTIYTLPDGSTSDAVYGPVELQLPANGWSAQNSLSEYVPGTMPSGTYLSTAFVGIYPDVVWASSAFTFDKLPGTVGWYPQNPGAAHGLSAVWFVDASTGWTVSTYQEIFHSIDGGDTWQLQDDGQFYPHEYHDVQFLDPQTGWVVGTGFSLGGTILHTDDGGVTWVEQDHESTYDLNSVFFVDSNHGWVVGGHIDTFGSNHIRVIEHTEDGGQTWSEQHWQSYSYPLQSIYFADVNHGWAVGGPGHILSTSNGGATWSEQSSGTVSYLEDIIFVSPLEGWCVGAGGVVLHTIDGGQSWQLQDTGTTSELRAVHFIDPLTGWVVGVNYDLYRPVILHTSDGGETWQAQDPGTGDAEIFLEDVFFVNASNGWSAGEAFYDIPVLLHTENGGGAQVQGSLFMDGFESGDTAAWTATEP